VLPPLTFRFTHQSSCECLTRFRGARISCFRVISVCTLCFPFVASPLLSASLKNFLVDRDLRYCVGHFFDFYALRSRRYLFLAPTDIFSLSAAFPFNRWQFSKWLSRLSAAAPLFLSPSSLTTPLIDFFLLTCPTLFLSQGARSFLFETFFKRCKRRPRCHHRPAFPPCPSGTACLLLGVVRTRALCSGGVLLSAGILFFFFFLNRGIGLFKTASCLFHFDRTEPASCFSIEQFIMRVHCFLFFSSPTMLLLSYATRDLAILLSLFFIFISVI